MSITATANIASSPGIASGELQRAGFFALANAPQASTLGTLALSEIGSTAVYSGTGAVTLTGFTAGPVWYDVKSCTAQTNAGYLAATNAADCRLNRAYYGYWDSNRASWVDDAYTASGYPQTIDSSGRPRVIDSSGNAFTASTFATGAQATAQLVTSGTAVTAGAATIVLANTASTIDALYNTETIQITAGTGAGQSRGIIAYLGGSKTLSVDIPWTVEPDGTSAYSIWASRSPALDVNAFAALTTATTTNIAAAGSLAAPGTGTLNAAALAAIAGALNGSGPVQLSHNSTSTDAFRVLLAGIPISGVRINAYPTAIGTGSFGPSTCLGQSSTGADGRWLAPIGVPLPTGSTVSYTLVFDKAGAFPAYSATVSVSSTGVVTTP